ncbi:hypothetical protein CDAR_316991 [Caerostris darwini]|uniref:Uncharacterized protein n=1 Tax=Caerostris darwini TaxID=1538125 RepID=A0AAV4Q4A3_9ARAC|nr:hypothetical protein CDAR_316991 [Caerostris darwini]
MANAEFFLCAFCSLCSLYLPAIEKKKTSEGTHPSINDRVFGKVTTSAEDHPLSSQKALFRMSAESDARLNLTSASRYAEEVQHEETDSSRNFCDITARFTVN